MKFSTLHKALLALSLSAAVGSSFATVLNIDSRVNGRPSDAPGSNTPVSITVGPGEYLFEHVGTETPGATFTAWNAWNRVLNCNASGSGCQNGWLNFVRFDLGENTQEQIFGDFTVWATPTLALEHAKSLPAFKISFANETTIRFNLADCCHWDNAGGKSVRVTAIPTPVPEPETYAMLLAGVGLLGWNVRRRRANQVS